MLVPRVLQLRTMRCCQQLGSACSVCSSCKLRTCAKHGGCSQCLLPCGAVCLQAVAGIVGCAELLCVALACPALLCYFMAVDQRYAAAQQLQGQQPTAGTTDARSDSSREASKQQVSGRSSRQTKGAAQSAGMGAAEQGSLSTADAVQHWLLVLAAAALAFCAALTKEIGTAVTGTMLLYDLLLAPHIRQPGMVAGSTGRQGAGQQQQSAAARRQLLRMVLVCATAVVYVKMRQWVAVEQLVNIFRKVSTVMGLSSLLRMVLTAVMAYAVLVAAVASVCCCIVI